MKTEKQNKIGLQACKISEQLLLPRGSVKLFFMEEQAQDVWMDLGGLEGVGLEPLFVYETSHVPWATSSV